MCSVMLLADQANTVRGERAKELTYVINHLHKNLKLWAKHITTCICFWWFSLITAKPELCETCNAFAKDDQDYMELRVPDRSWASWMPKTGAYVTRNWILCPLCYSVATFSQKGHCLLIIWCIWTQNWMPISWSISSNLIGWLGSWSGLRANHTEKSFSMQKHWRQWSEEKCNFLKVELH